MIEAHPHRLTPDERAYLLDLIRDRFGIDPTVFDDFRFERTSKRYVMIEPVDHHPSPEVNVISTGMPFVRVNLAYPKLTTAAAMLFGRYATRNIVPVEGTEARRYVDGDDLVEPHLPSTATLEPGYVLVRWGEIDLGLGLMIVESDRVRLKSLYPRRWSPVGATPAGSGT